MTDKEKTMFKKIYENGNNIEDFELMVYINDTQLNNMRCKECKFKKIILNSFCLFPCNRCKYNPNMQFLKNYFEK